MGFHHWKKRDIKKFTFSIYKPYSIFDKGSIAIAFVDFAPSVIIKEHTPLFWTCSLILGKLTFSHFESWTIKGPFKDLLARPSERKASL